MYKIVSLQVQTVAHIPKSVRPLLAEILVNELQQAQFSGIWGFVRLTAFAKSDPIYIYDYHIEEEGGNAVLSAPCYLLG